MNYIIYRGMMKGLISTIKEKECVGGNDESTIIDILKYIDIIKDLECFWNSMEEFSTTELDEEIKEILIKYDYE